MKFVFSIKPGTETMEKKPTMQLIILSDRFIICGIFRSYNNIVVAFDVSKLLFVHSNNESIQNEIKFKWFDAEVCSVWSNLNELPLYQWAL